MKYTVISDFIVVEVVRTEKSTRLKLGDIDFNGSKVFFVADDKLVQGLQKMDVVSVEMELKTVTRRVHDRKSEEAEFLEVVSNSVIKSIKKIEQK